MHAFDIHYELSKDTLTINVDGYDDINLSFLIKHKKRRLQGLLFFHQFQDSTALL